MIPVINKLLVVTILIFGALAEAGESNGSGGSLSSFSALSTENSLMTRNSIVMTPASSEGVVDSTYKLGPGDYLDLMLENSYLSVQVYPDGYITIDECGSVSVAGKTLSEARSAILKLVAKKYDARYCFVQLAQMKKFRVNVMGAVQTMGQMVVDPQTRLSFLLRTAGILPGVGNEENVLVIRNGDTLHVNCLDVFDKGDFKQDIVLEQGDEIYVPFADMKDAVTLILPSHRVALPYKKNRTIDEYFKMAGGERFPNAGYNSIMIRNKDQSNETISISEKETKTVQPGAEIEFSVKSLLVYVGGAVVGVGRVQYDPSWHAIDYIAATGITPVSGSWYQVSVIRNGKSLHVNVHNDPILPGDYIEMPRSHYESFKDFTLFVASLLTVISSAFIIYVNYK